MTLHKVFVQIKGAVYDSLNRTPLPGAVISIINSYEISTQVVGNKGEFSVDQFNLTDPYPIKLEISCLGYRIKKYDLSVQGEDIQLGKVLLGPDPLKIDEIVVKARARMFDIKKDTMYIFPASIFTPKGSTAVDLLKKIPGVKTDGESVEVMGELIEMAYVNGKATFGNNPADALNNIEAKDLSLIKVYDEERSETDPDRTISNRKRRVIDLLTFDAINHSLNASLTTAMGSDFDRDPQGELRDRYNFGGRIMSFNENRQIKAGILAQNAGLSTNAFRYSEPVYGGGRDGYAETINAVVMCELPNLQKRKYWGGELSYMYSSYYRRDAGHSQDDYFPLSGQPGRTYSAENASTSKTETHSITLAAGNQAFMLNNFVDLRNGDRKSYSTSRNLADGILVNGYDNASGGKGDGYNIQSLLSGGFKLTAKSSIRLMAQMFLTNNDDDGWLNNTSVAESDMRHVVERKLGENSNLSISPTYSLNINEKQRFDFEYIFGYVRGRVDNLAYDRMSGIIDYSLSRDYHDERLSNSCKASYSYTFKPGIFINADITGINTRLDKSPDKYMAGDAARRYDFMNLLPSIRFFHGALAKSFNVGYSTLADIPKVDMFIEKIDDRNPIMLSVGNPDLKGSYTHNLSASASINDAESQTSKSVSVNAKFTRNAIVSRSSYFSQDTYLPEYDYTAPQGSTLNTFENASGKVNLDAKASYSTPVNPIRCIVTAEVNYGFSKEPGYLGETLTTARSHTPMIGLGIESNFSGNISLSVKSSTAYRYMKSQTGSLDRAWSENVTAKTSVRFLEYATFNADYILSNYVSFDYSYATRHDNVLNLSLSYKVLHNRRGEVSVTAYDILNRNEGFESRMYPDRVSTVWSVRSPRFFLVSFVYRLANVK